MTTELLLSETVATVAKSSGNRWKAVLAVPGQGQSGFYTPEVLREFGPAAFPAGTKAFIGHNSPDKRDPRDQLGKYPKGAWYDETLDKNLYPDGALVGELEVFSRYKAVMEDLDSDAELSIYASGETDDLGNVISMKPSRTNTCDLISYAGLSGSGLLEKMYESIHGPDDQIGTSDPVKPTNTNGYKMDEELKKALYALQTSIDSLAAGPKPKTEAETKADFDAAVKAEFDSKASTLVDTALAQVAAIDEAKLLPSMAESLKNDVKAGKDITESLASAKVTMEEFKTTLAESMTGTDTPLVNGHASSAESWTVSSVAKAVY